MYFGGFFLCYKLEYTLNRCNVGMKRNMGVMLKCKDGGMPKSLDYSVEMGAQGKYLCLKNQRVEVWSTIWIDFE